MSSKSKSPKSPKSKSNKKDSSPGGKKKPTPVDIQPQEPWVKTRSNRNLAAYDYFDLAAEKNYRCPFCQLVYNNILQFIIHSCWRKYFEVKLYLVDARVFRCPNCESLFQTLGDYSFHKCVEIFDCSGRPPGGEQVSVIDKWQHLDFYINWRIRYEIEAGTFIKKLVAICSRCNMHFYSKLSFLVHSCAQNPRHTMFFICDACKLVYWSYHDREQHYLTSAPGIGKTGCRDEYELTLEMRFPCLLTTTWADYWKQMENNASWRLTGPERLLQLISSLRDICEPTMLPQHCEDFEIVNKPDCLRCFKCTVEFCNFEEYLLHTCVAGHLYDPLSLQLFLHCEKCNSTFPRTDWFINHLGMCVPENLTLVRLNKEVQLRNFFRRWQKELWSQRHMPARINIYRCGICYRQFRTFKAFIIHERDQHARKILPLQLLETYACSSCNQVVFRCIDMLSHLKKCTVACKPEMIKTHYELDEVLEALKTWMRSPQFLKVDLNILQQKYKIFLWD